MMVNFRLPPRKIADTTEPTDEAQVRKNRPMERTIDISTRL